MGEKNPTGPRTLRGLQAREVNARVHLNLEILVRGVVGGSDSTEVQILVELCVGDLKEPNEFAKAVNENVRECCNLAER